jgi:DNA-binding winged helix-turn-helix (wHTH) protein
MGSTARPVAMSNHVSYSFGAYRLDPAKWELWCGEARVRVQPKVLGCLAYLIEHRDRAVGKDELIAAVWGKTDLSDNVLGQIIGRARHAVGDTGEEQRVIRTLNRIGYRWVLPVDAVAADSGSDQVPGDDAGGGSGEASGDRMPGARVRAGTDAALTLPNSNAPTTTGTRTSTKRWQIATAATLLLTVLGVAGLVVRDRQLREPVAGEIAVVLPVVVRGGEEVSWIRLGVMDYLANCLRAAGQAVVPSDNAVALARSMKNSEQPKPEEVQAVANGASAGLVISARAESSNDHWRVTLHTLLGREPALTAEGEGKNVLAAARNASDRMGVLLGFSALADQLPGTGRPDLDAVLPKVQAAMLSNRFNEARELLDRLPTRLQEHPRVHLERAAIDLGVGRYTDAGKTYELLLTGLPAQADPLLRASILHGLAHVRARSKDIGSSEDYEGEAIRLLEPLSGFEANKLLGSALISRGVAHAFQLEPAAAREDYARARMALENAGDQMALAKLDGNLALLSARLGNYQEALPYAERAAERLVPFDAVQAELLTRTILVELHLGLLNPAAALAEEPRIEALLTRSTDSNIRMTVNLYRIEMLLANGQLKAAKYLLQETSGAISQAVQVVPQANWPEAIAARLALAAGNPEAAVSMAREALDRPWTSMANEERARAWLTLLRAQLRLGLTEDARQTLSAAQTWGNSSPNTSIALYLSLLQAELAAATENHSDADAAFQQTVQQAEARGMPIEQLYAAESYTAYLLHRGDTDRAGVIAGRVAGWADRQFDAALLQLRVYHARHDSTAWRAALDRARALAGERQIPEMLLVPPQPRPLPEKTALAN